MVPPFVPLLLNSLVATPKPMTRAQYCGSPANQHAVVYSHNGLAPGVSAYLQHRPCNTQLFLSEDVRPEHISPPHGAGFALEGAHNLARDPPPIKITSLRFDLLTIHVCGIHLRRVERDL